MNAYISALSIILAAVSPTTALKWQLDNFQCDTDPFEDMTITVLCDGTSSCTFGDTAVISGQLTAIDEFSNNRVTIKACAAGICPESYTKNVGKLCDWLMPLDDQNCGEIGDYEISDTIKIPSEKNVPTGSALLSKLVTVKVTIGEDDECSMGSIATNYLSGHNNFGTANQSAAHPTSTMFAFIAMFALMAGTLMYATWNRRQRRREELLGEERTIATRYAKC